MVPGPDIGGPVQYTRTIFRIVAMFIWVEARNIFFGSASREVRTSSRHHDMTRQQRSKPLEREHEDKQFSTIQVQVGSKKRKKEETAQKKSRTNKGELPNYLRHSASGGDDDGGRTNNANPTTIGVSPQRRNFVSCHLLPSCSCRLTLRLRRTLLSLNVCAYNSHTVWTRCFLT